MDLKVIEKFPYYRRHDYLYGDDGGTYIIVEFSDYKSGTIVESTCPHFNIGYYAEGWSDCRKDIGDWSNIGYTWKGKYTLDDSLFEIGY